MIHPHALNRPLIPFLALALAAASGCKKQEAPKPPPHAATAPQPKAEVTILVTGDENGWLVPAQGEAPEQGGPSRLLQKWVKDEGHCVKPSPGCGTVALTTGDHFNGPAISSFFFGQPAAEVMGKMGYAASGLGNHELDFGLDGFHRDQQLGGFPYLAANVQVEQGGPDLGLKPYLVVERRGAKIGVIGLANVNADKRVMAGQFHGVTFKPYEETLASAVPAVWKEGADAVVVLVDECPKELEQTLSAHPEWKLSLLVGGHCRGAYQKKLGETWAFSPGKHFAKYVRARITVDPSKPAGQKLASAEAAVVDVGSGPASPEIDALVNGWKQKLDQALGEEIGFTKTGLKEGSPQLSKWITTAWRDTLHTDVALVNKRGIRQGLPAGKITKASVYSVLPFEDSLMIVKLPGEALAKALSNPEALFTGAAKAGKGFKDAKGKPVDPKKTYTVATEEFLYFGGDGFEMEPSDPMPTETGMVWQTPVIEWTKKQGTSGKKPLEKMLK